MLLLAVKENNYNFELVASALNFAGPAISDLEKRSAWECFERFRIISPEANGIQLAGPNKNFAQNRLEKSGRLNQMNRVRQNTIVRQPRLEVRKHRYLNLFDVMRKSAKNREKHKAQEKPLAKKPKDNLPTKPAISTPTPLDLSRLKAERDRAYTQQVMAERQAQVSRLSINAKLKAARLQLPPNASPELKEEIQRKWMAAQQQQALLAQAGGQAIRQNPTIGRGLVIPGGPNGRPMPIRPNNGTAPIAGALPLRLPGTPTPEQIQQLMRRQLAIAAANGQQVSQQQVQQRLRALHQQAQVNAAQQVAAAGGVPAQNPTTNNPMADYIPFVPQAGAQSVQGIP
jgi:hypothetical protein